MEKIAVPSSALPNPLREGLVEERIPEPATMVIFGASGDLARRKLLPALYSLTRDRLLPARFAVRRLRRTPRMTTRFATRCARGCDEFARRRPVDARALGHVRAQPLLPAGGVRRSGGVPAAEGAARGDRADAGARPATGSSICRPRRRPSRRSIRSLGAGGPGAPSRRRGKPVRARDHREAVRHRPGDGARAQPRRPRDRSTSSRSTASITTSGKRRSRTCSSSASPTASSSRSGTTASSTTCRSPAPRRSASRGAAATSSRPASCATWCRTTCSRS